MKQNIKIVYIVVIALLLAIFAAPTESKASSVNTFEIGRPLQVCADSMFYPYEFINEKGEPDGFNIDLLEALMKRLDVKYELRLRNLSYCLNELKNNRIDLIIGALYTKARAEYLHYGIPHNQVRLTIVSHKKKSYKSIEEIREKRIAVQKDDMAHDYLRESKLTNYIIEVHNIADAFKILEVGDCDAVLSFNYAARYYIKKNGIKGLVEFDPGLGHINYTYVVNKNNENLLYALNKELFIMKYDGEYDAIYDKWFVEDQKESIQRGLIVGLCVLGVLLLISFVFVTILRFKIKQKTSDLSLSESKFKAIFNAVDEAFLVHTLDGTVIDCNSTYVQMSEFESRKNILGKFYLDVYPPHLRSKCTNFNQDLKSGNVRCECMETMKNGDSLWVELSAAFVEINGQTCVLTVIRNINKHKSIEEELENTHNQLSIAFDAGEISAWHLNVETGMFTTIHGNVIAQDGMSLEDCVNMMKPSERTRFISQIEDLSCGKIHHSKGVYQFMQYGTDQSMYLESFMIVEKSNEGKIVGIVGTQKNITENYEVLKALSDYRLKTELVFKASEIVQYDYDNRVRKFVTINEDKLLQGMAIPSETYLGLVHPDDRKVFSTNLRLMNRGVDRSFTIELRMRTPSEKDYQWSVLNAIPIQTDDNGKVVKYTGFRRNNTKWKKITEDLINLTNKAEESNRLKTAFLANISHEIRTPLNAIVGFSELIIEDDNIDKESRREYFDIIKANNDMLLQIIGDILALSKVETEAVESIDLVNSVVNVEGLFTDLIKIWEEKYSEKNILVDCNVPNFNFTIISDRSRLTQILGNLLSNAIKFTQRGSIRIGCNLINDNNDIYFYVSDTGCGVPDNMSEAIFEPFVKLNNFQQGTGLGLSICKSIVEKMGGEIGVNSKIGEFSTFWFRIPNLQNRKNAELKHNTEVEIPVESFSLRSSNNRILVAEDDDSNYRLVETILGDDYVLFRANNGAQAVDLIKECNPKLILMDIKMPQMDGYEATKHIRQFNSDIPILAVTAYAFENDKQRILSSGFNGYISKPVRSKTLRSYISNLFTELESNHF